MAVNAWHVPALAYSVPGYVPISADWTAEQATKLLEAALAELAAGRNVDVETRAVEGSAYDTLTRLATDPDVELVVVGRGGHGTLASLFLGSVSHSLSHHCVKPLVIVPQDHRGRDASGMAHIVVGVDGSDGARRALRWAAAEARIHGARLEVVMVWSWTDSPHGVPGEPTWKDAPTTAHEMLKAAVEELHIDDVDLVLSEKEGVPWDALVDATGSADLLVVGTRGMGRTKEILLGSTSHYCTHHSPVPVAVIPAIGHD